MKMESTFVIAFLLCLTSIASSSDRGRASYYSEPYIPSSCFGVDDKGTDIAAVSDALWDNSQACGQRFRIVCKNVINESGTNYCKVMEEGETSKAVTVVDYCGNCNGFTMLLSKKAFEHLAQLEAGNIQISYERL